MIKNAVVIGYGSAGRRHAKELSKLNYFSKVFVVTKQVNCPYETLNNISEIKEINPYYIVISSETKLHYKHLLFLEKKLKNKIILVEKPLFDKYQNFKSKNNKIFVGYNMRLNPTLLFLKNFIKNKNIYNARITCCSNLKTWRKNINYNESYSADIKRGGGVLLDLSHEIDYLNWLFPDLNILFSVNNKISNLNISSDDFLNIFGKINNKSFFQITLNYFSIISERKIILDGQNLYVEADLIKNTIIIKDSKKITKKSFKINIFKNNLHYAILNNKIKNICSIDEGLYIMKLVKKIKKMNLYKI